MTFSNLYALYENACLDYEVSVLTEGADSEEAKTAKAKKTGLASKIFAAVGVAFQKLLETIKKLLTFIKRRFVREKIKLANDVLLVPIKDYKTIIANLAKYIIAGDELTIKATFFKDVLLMKATSVKAGSIVDKTAYVETLEKLEKLVKKFAALKTKAENFVEQNADSATEDRLEKKQLDAAMYAKMEKYVRKLVEEINTNIKIISNNAVPEDVAPVNDKKEKADTNNESATFGGLTRNELRAQLLIEAADLLNEGAATEARKEIIGDIKLKRKTELYKNFIDNKMDYNEAKKYYATIKKEIALLKTKLKNFPEETTVERIMSTFAPFILTGVIGGAVVIGLRGQEGTFSSILKAVGLTYAIISMVFGIPIAAIEYNSKDEQGKKINFNKYKVELKLAGLEEDIDETMFLYDSRNKQYKE